MPKKTVDPSLAALRKSAAEHEAAMIEAQAAGDHERAAAERDAYEADRREGDALVARLALEIRRQLYGLEPPVNSRAGRKVA